MEEPDAIEKIGGNIVTKAAAVAVAVVGAGTGVPIAAAFPLFVDAIPSARHKARVQSAIRALEDDVGRLRIELLNLSDAQYKLAGEAVAAMHRAIDDQKLELLRHVFLGAAQDSELTNNSAYTMSRIIRDISAPEFEFLASNFGKEFLFFESDFSEGSATPDEMRTKYQLIKRTLVNEEMIAGLQSLGLIVQSQREVPSFEFTRAAGQLFTLVRGGS